MISSKSQTKQDHLSMLSESYECNSYKFTSLHSLNKIWHFPLDLSWKLTCSNLCNCTFLCKRLRTATYIILVCVNCNTLLNTYLNITASKSLVEIFRAKSAPLWILHESSTFLVKIKVYKSYGHINIYIYIWSTH